MKKHWHILFGGVAVLLFLFVWGWIRWYEPYYRQSAIVAALEKNTPTVRVEYESTSSASYLAYQLGLIPEKAYFLSVGERTVNYRSGPSWTLDETNLKRIAAMPFLSMFHIYEAELPPEGITPLIENGSIRAIHLYGSNFDDEMAEAIPRSLRLENFCAQFSPLTEKGVDEILDKCPRLNSLFLIGLPDCRLTEAQGEKIGSRTFTSLSFDELPIDDAFFAKICTNSKLWSLGLRKTAITNLGLEAMKGTPNLWHLVLSETKITDAGLAHLAGLSELRSLRLDGTNVTDAGLERLKTLILLRELFLWETDVTEAAAKEFEKTIPGLTVHWSAKPESASEE